MEFISSSKNSFFKELKGLRLKKNRDAKGQFIIEGLRFVEEGIKAGVEIKSLIFSESFYGKITGENGSQAVSDATNELLLNYIRGADKLERDKGGITVLGDGIFPELCDTDNPQGVLAVVQTPYLNGLDEVGDRIKNGSFVVILDVLQDPGNMGTVIRTGDAAGADCIVLTDGCVDPYNPKTLRATMGSVFHVPVVKGGDSLHIIRYLQQEGYRVYASHLRGSMNVFDADMSGKVAVIVGNEGRGISDETAEAADCLVKIPMPGQAESLNASVAAGILIYEVVRKKCI